MPSDTKDVLVEFQLQAALAALRNGDVASVRAAAKMFDVPRSTLQGRLHGAKSATIRQQSLQRLSVDEEQSIVHAIYTVDRWGWSMSSQWLETFTLSILRAKGDHQPLGHNWYTRFIDRHEDAKMTWLQNRGRLRKGAEDPGVIQEWFQLFQNTVKAYGIAHDDIYNADEKGVMKGIGAEVRAIISRREGEAISCPPGKNEWITVIESIGMNGDLLPPFVIFEGKRVQKSWVDRKIDPRMEITVSEKGWTDNQLALAWLKHFDAMTAQTHGSYRLLILNGHSGHASYEFVKYCGDHGIIPLCLPPHAAHLLQPLDLAFFGPLSDCYKSLAHERSLFGAQKATNEQFLDWYQIARLQSHHNIPSAWNRAGLNPINPRMVLDCLKPKKFKELVRVERH